MNLKATFLLTASILLLSFKSPSQELIISEPFRLGSPYNEPDGRNDVVKLSETDFVTLAKVKGSFSGKSEFVLERIDASLKPVWQTSLLAESYEDYKEIFFNGKDIVLLSVIHKVEEKKTILEMYGFDPLTGNKNWRKELESFEVGDWEMHLHKGKVKESFTDIICEHVNSDFITPFEYKHNISFSPDHKKMMSYVFNYAEKNLTAHVSVYDTEGNLLARGKVSIDNDYINHGMYVNNSGKIFIANSNLSGKFNLIKFDLQTRVFDILELPASNYLKDDFHIHFINDDELIIANTELLQDKLQGVMYSKFNFVSRKVEKIVFEELKSETKNKIQAQRKENKHMKGEDDWRDYDLVHLLVNSNQEVTVVLEKRTLHAEGYPHIARSTFDKSHKVELNAHTQAEGILIFSFMQSDELGWITYLPKNQIYPSGDGLNSISFVLDENTEHIRLLFATSENLDASLNTIHYTVIDKKSGSKVNEVLLPNKDKITFIREYTLWNKGDVTIVGKKGIMGKTSIICKYKL